MFFEGADIVITEPMTMVTDYVLALQAWLHGRALQRKAGGNPSEQVSKWIKGFYAAGVGALAGGTLHGFQLTMSRSALIFLLLMTVIGVVAASFSLLEAGLDSARQPGAHDPLRLASGARWLKRMALAAGMGGLIVVAGPSLHEHFNQNDLAHIVLMFGLYSGYRAVTLRHNFGD
jgi:hypothetical protein